MPTTHSPSAQNNKITLGKRGEQLAFEYIHRQGWQVISRNWRCSQGEIDCIAHDGCALVFIEIRTRRGTDGLSKALESVQRKKQIRLRQLAEIYCTQHHIADTVPIRIDVIGIAILPDGQAHIETITDAAS